MYEYLKNLSDLFNTFSCKRVTKVSFVHNYYELWMNESYLRFLSETYLEIPNQKEHYYLGKKEGNYFFSQLLGQSIKKIVEGKESILIEFENGVRINVDTCLNAPADNFHMGTVGKIPAQI